MGVGMGWGWWAVPQRVAGAMWGEDRGGGVWAPSRRRRSAAGAALAAPHELEESPLRTRAPDWIQHSGGPEAVGVRA